MKKWIFISYVFFLFALAGCDEKVTIQEYVQWVEDNDNGFNKAQYTANADYVLQYEPGMYRALKKSAQTGSFSDFDNLQNSGNSSMHHFLLKVKPKSSETATDKSIVEFLAHHMDNRIQFVNGTDTLKRTIMYHLESSPGITPFHRILLAYPETGEKQDLKALTLRIKSNPLEPDNLQFTISQNARKKHQSLMKKLTKEHYDSY